jgi:ferredoxin
MPECPEGAISEGAPFMIDAALCTECGACAEVCPVDACRPAQAATRA